ncbi:hypothetical protein [Rothia kristinae]|nr:hypothetical protein [Rothia kristinae]
MRGSRPEDQYGYVDEHGRYVRPGTESEAAPERARPAVGPSS